MNADEARILADLDRHASLFDFSEHDLGEDALDAATTGVLKGFEEETDPDGVPWDELSTDYARWKGKHFPGEPMGVLKGLMRSEIPGEREVTPEGATWTYGTSEEARELATWFQEGDPENNRPPRRFADLTGEAIKASDRLFDRHFDEGTR